MTAWTPDRVNAICEQINDFGARVAAQANVSASPSETEESAADQTETMVIQHHVLVDDETVSWWWSITSHAHGAPTVTASPGTSETPSVTINLSEDAASQIAVGTVSPTEALLYGSLSIDGDLATAQRFVVVLRALSAAS